MSRQRARHHALSGVGTLTAGTFSCDPGCPAKGELSTHQQLHNASSVLTFSAWIAAPFIAARQLRCSRFGRLSLAIGVVALVFGVALGSMTDHTADDPVGLLQRIVLVAVGVRFALLALAVRRDVGALAALLSSATSRRREARQPERECQQSGGQRDRCAPAGAGQRA